MQRENHVAQGNQSGESIETTLLELVQSFAQDGRAEHEIVAVVLELIGNEDVALIGNFRGERFEGGGLSGALSRRSPSATA